MQLDAQGFFVEHLFSAPETMVAAAAAVAVH
jgi:hypothetical protein